MTDAALTTLERGGTEDQKHESAKSRAARLSHTRAEIKKLIKIQNKHTKLLQKLQASGVIRSADADSVALADGSASKASLAAANGKEAISTQLLHQMQGIFKYLA